MPSRSMAHFVCGIRGYMEKDNVDVRKATMKNKAFARPVRLKSLDLEQNLSSRKQTFHLAVNISLLTKATSLFKILAAYIRPKL